MNLGHQKSRMLKLCSQKQVIFYKLLFTFVLLNFFSNQRMEPVIKKFGNYIID